VAASIPITVNFSKAMDPASVLQSVYVTQNGVTFAGTLAMQNSNQSVQFTASAPFAAGTVINVFVLPTAADPYGLTIYRTFTSNFTVASASTPAAVQSTSFARTAAPNGALEVFFDQPLKPETVNGENVWLRTGKRAVAGNVSLRGDRIVRFVPAARMDASLEYSLTMGPGLQALTSGRVQPQEFPLAWRKAPM
jgi:hypothetical protein